MKPVARIFVAGHRGMVGSAIVRRLQADGFSNLILRSRAELDLTRQGDVENFFAEQRPEYVFLAAAKVGGIHANSTYPAEFIRDNLAIQTNVIHAAWKHGVRRLLFLGSSCIYPRDCPQPIKEDYLLTGPLEPTNEAYAVAKIAGVKMCEAYRKQYGFDAICLMPTNLYGPNDNYHPTDSHVIPGLIRRFLLAHKEKANAVTIWGDGTPVREFLHVDDLARASTFLIESNRAPAIVNVGSGESVTISQLASMISKAVEFHGTLVYDHSRPGGTPIKKLDSSLLRRLGWSPEISLEAGIREVCKAPSFRLMDTSAVQQFDSRKD